MANCCSTVISCLLVVRDYLPFPSKFLCSDFGLGPGRRKDAIMVMKLGSSKGPPDPSHNGDEDRLTVTPTLTPERGESGD